MVHFVFVVLWCVTGSEFVFGLEFTMSPQRVKLGTEGKVDMACAVTETDISMIYSIQICRKQDNNWTVLADIDFYHRDMPVLKIENGTCCVVGRFLNTTYPENSILTVEIDIEMFTVTEDIQFICNMSYKNIHNNVLDAAAKTVILKVDETDNETNETANSQRCLDKNTSEIIGAIMGATNVLTLLYTCYLIVVIKRLQTRFSDDAKDKNHHPVKNEIKPEETYDKSNLRTAPKAVSADDIHETYDLCQ